MTEHPDIFSALAAPFDSDEVKLRSQAGKQLHYVTARTVMNRLDDVLGPENWWDDFVPMEHSVICRLTIKLPDGTVLTKSDAGGYAGMQDQGDDDKSGFADSFKRAAVKFGVGRYLYRDGVPRFARDNLKGQMSESETPSHSPTNGKPTKAPDQEQPFDPKRLPKAGTGAMYYWLVGLGKLYGSDLVAKVNEICKASDPPMTTTYKEWDKPTLDAMVQRVIKYCKRLYSYKGEFGEPGSEPQGEPDPELNGARAACYAQASILHALYYPETASTKESMGDLIAGMSNGEVKDLFHETNIEAIRRCTTNIKQGIADKKKTVKV